MKLVIIRKGEGVKRFEVVEREGGGKMFNTT
jgi:hypothetical protein